MKKMGKKICRTSVFLRCIANRNLRFGGEITDVLSDAKPIKCILHGEAFMIEYKIDTGEDYQPNYIKDFPPLFPVFPNLTHFLLLFPSYLLRPHYPAASSFENEIRVKAG